ncbi:hypothetical protein Nepgr_006859 [Nepenthes gracilis]|uniref:Uncharacterized protein n=1 Tax=Nepenthes gracilis TaxID=150966 RepID=A0AAD3S653_NEPGR|nr:hypothetical protein Nepgr_006859 [Nepenthes gracilis]
MSSTASSSVLPPSTEAAASQHLTMAAPAEPSRWFSMVDSGGAGPSDVHHGREADYHPVVDMADVMFNYGSSRSNSMELIFPSSASEPKDSKN